MRGGKAGEWMIHDEQVVTLDVLLYRSFAKFAQAPPVPLNANFRMLPSVFGSSSDQGSVSAGMIPGDTLQRYERLRLQPASKITSLSNWMGASRPAVCVRNT